MLFNLITGEKIQLNFTLQPGQQKEVNYVFYLSHEMAKQPLSIQKFTFLSPLNN
jgi:hypothetical protein